ncbi:WD40 repeat-like protein [Rhizoctonia solani]|uniref:WD40 repeat-like protein n=1 Tax=Rhizoctonia solani TaxID=456999 RepID=A0A8H7I6N2_9AGAM|nr:WD40 repeat-like protein [Rhizoctonia solani]
MELIPIARLASSRPNHIQAMLTPGSRSRQATVLTSNNNIAVSSPTPAEPGVHWPFLDSLSNAISPVADAFGPLKAIFSDLIDCVHIYEMAAKDRQDYEALRLSLTKTLEELRAHFTGQDSPEMSDAISGLCESIQQEINSVKALEAEGMVRRHIRAGSGSDEIEMSRSIHQRLERQSRDLKEQAMKAEEQTKKIEEEAKKAKEQAKKTGELAKAIELKRGECTAGTRLEVLANMRQWASTPGSDSGSHSPVFGAALLKALERDPDIHTRVPAIQFASLLVEPLLKTKPSLKHSLIVVIDALDECENQEKIHQEMRKRMNAERYSQLILHELDSNTVQTDIHKYIRAALAPMDQVSDSQITQLVGDCGVLFIYAATASGAKQKDKAINDLYTVILKVALEDEDIDDTERKDILRLLHTVVTAQEPLTISALSGLLQLGSEDRVRAAIRPLWSVLHITGSNELVATLHASFPDYMLSKERSGDYYCDRKLYDSVMARLCLECIAATRPRFNICGLDSSAVLDKDVPNLHQKIQNAVPAHLIYACRHFASHLEAATEPHELTTLVQEFMSTQLLLWLEVMNLTGNIQTAEKAMRRVDSWAMAHTDTPELQELAHDAWCFTTSFGSNIVCASTPHIYVSMLPFWPSSRPISQAYKGLYRGLPEVGGTAMDMRQLAILATCLFKAASCAVFSRDGSRVALALGWEVIVADPYSGRPIVEPLQEHTKTVTSVDFSPDGTRIVSGSDDQSIRVWDVEGRQLVLGPLQGHSKLINSTRLVIEPPEEHRSPISSIRYSPDGAHIVAGLHNGQLYVWHASTGALVLGPLQAHMEAIRSIDYSPDGTHILSGSHDDTIRIWNAVDGHAVPGPLWSKTRTGTVVLGPLKAHNSSITSICYSPDGTRIVSCAGGDATVYTWDARRRQKALPVAEGCAPGLSGLRTRPIAHASPYQLSDVVDYSPTGDQFASSSLDNTICTWDAQTGHMLLGPLTGHIPTGSGQLHTRRTAHRLLLGQMTAQYGQSTSHPMALTSYPAPEIVPYECGTYRQDRQYWGRWKTAAENMHRCDTRRGATTYAALRTVIWVLNANTGDALVSPLMGHTDSISSIAISPEGTRIVSGSGGRAIRVWDVDAKPNSSSATSSRAAWKLNDDGWVVEVLDSSRLLVWVPHDLRASLMLPQTPFLVSEKGYLTLFFGNACIGNSWIELHRPTF